MALVPERLNPFSGRKETLSKTPNKFETSTEMEGLGIQNVETDFPATAKDAQTLQGQPLIQTPQTQPLTITVPAPSQEALEQIRKTANKDETVFGRAIYWIRAIEKAFHFGKRILFGSPKVNQPV